MYRKLVFVLSLWTCALGSQGFLDGDLDLTEGVKLVSVPISNNLIEEDGRSFGENTVLNRMAKFLQGHELHVKLPSLVEKDKLNTVLSESLKTLDETYKESAVTGRGKGGGGGGGAALIGLMFAKALGAAGIGALGLLTMKALAVSALALLLSAVVGIKKMSHHDDHDDHQVIYAGHHGHHRRRRSVNALNTPLPYRAWTEYSPNENHLS